MLIRLFDFMKKTDNLSFPHKGIVVDNLDDKKIGRIKCTVEGIIEGDEANLPFIHPHQAYGLCGSSDEASFHVPEVGAEVVVTFPFDDIHFPMYSGSYNSENIKSALFDTDYPNTWGFRDSTETKLTVNKTSSDLNFHHTSGIKVDMDVDGNMSIHVPDSKLVNVVVDLIKTIGENRKITIGDDNTIKIGGNDTLIVDGNRTKTITGNETDTITGNKTETIILNELKTVLGNKTETITLNDLKTVILNATQTILGNKLSTTTGTNKDISLSKKTIKAPEIDLDDGSGSPILCNNYIICPILGTPHGLNQNIKVSA